MKINELNKRMKILNKELGGFIFILFKYCDDILNQYPEIIPEDITKLFYLATYVDFDGYLVNNEQYMKRVEVNSILGISRKNFDVFFNKMKRNNILVQDKNKNIKVSQEYFIKGNINKKINSDYTRAYIRSIRYLFENVSSRKHKQLGNYFKMIPYIHRQYNTLCWNPSSNYKDMKIMNVKELKNILGYTKAGLKGFMKELFATKLKNGQSIIGFFLTDYDDAKSYIIINPNVFYGGNFDIRNHDDIPNFDYGRNQVIKWF